MTNNDILRRLRYALKYNDGQMATAIAHITGEAYPTHHVARWLMRDEDDGFREISDVELCQFLDGLIIEKRGPRPDGTTPEPLTFLSTNEILKKLRIALTLHEEAMMEVFAREEFVVTKAELGSFFRKEGHRNFRKCPEQVLRKFLQGLGKGAQPKTESREP